MLYGFLGFQPTVDGFALAPTLPKDWPSLSISDIRIHDYVLDITAEQSGRVRFGVQQSGSGPLTARIRNREIRVPVHSRGSEIEISP
jgi:cellobiose phosphorylase